MFCPRCGSAVPEGATYCPRCGAPQAAAAAPTPAPAPDPAPPVAAAGAWPAPAAAAPSWSAAPGTPVMVVPAVTYAGFWRRFWALVIDSILISMVTVPMQMMVGIPWAFSMRQMSDFDPDRLMSMIGAGLLVKAAQVVLSWAYVALMQSSSRQATLGMMALGIRVTDLEGRRISFARATGRYFASFLSDLTLGIGYLVQLFTQRRQTLHDMVAGTLVLKPGNTPPAVQ
jgi:uncharacterized RDD family membrane protein YckC